MTTRADSYLHINPPRTRALHLLIVVLLMAAQITATAEDMDSASSSAVPQTTEELGRQIYQEGVLPSGQSIGGVVLGDIPLRGEQLFCGNCHGRSGLGSIEGPIITPPTTGTYLFEPKEIRRRELYASRTFRPAFTDESLKRAIRLGIDANGEAMHEMMPRYVLSDEDIELLITYLKSLSSSISPGVTDDSIHFATVVTEGVDDKRRRAMLDVLTAFVDSKNAATRQEVRRSEHAPFFREWRYESYRKWVLHVWDLTGPQADWNAQLEQYYERQPVFAMISGIGTGSWRPVHEFCESRSVPCLLPNTDLPVVSETDYYSLYFSKGITLEAEALARHLREDDTAVGRIIQVYRDDELAMAAAVVLRQGLESEGPANTLDRIVAQGEQITAEFWRTLVDGDESYSLVLWLGNRDLSDLDVLANLDPSPHRIYLASTFFSEPLETIPKSLRDKIYLLYPYDLPQDSAGRPSRINYWLRRQDIEITDDRLQTNVLFTAILVSQALKHIGSNFYRDYFLEKIEHIMDRMATLATYPNLSLAKGQRFAAKGCYVATLAEGSDGEIVLEGEWIVP